MEVVHGLAAIATRVDHTPVAVCVQAFLSGRLAGEQHHFTEFRAVVGMGK